MTSPKHDAATVQSAQEVWQPGWAEPAVTVLGVVIALAHLYFNTLGNVSTLWQNALHFSGFALMGGLIYRRSARHPSLRPVVFVMDIALGAAAAAAAVYLVAMEDAIYQRGVRLAMGEWIAGGVLILAALELTRRATGWLIPTLIVVALSYASWWGEWAPGVFRFTGLSTETILFRSVYGDDAIFGNIARISSTFVFLFILFGAFLLRSGAGEFIIDLSRVLAGRLIGGPGFVAVLASGMTGTISGSAIANTASTGVITIPMMKRAGFPPRFAAAVEASASTGGQIMPPIMGAGAFVMASYTNIPYSTIVTVSLLPAVLYFLAIGFFVRIEAKRQGVRLLEQDGPSLGQVMCRGGLVFLLPVGLLVGMLIYGFSPTYGACWAIGAVVVASWFTPNRMDTRAVCEALANGSRSMLMTAILLCSVGLIVNVIAMTGTGNTFSLMITAWAGNSLLLAVFLIALASLVLGMGLPVTASYIVLATLSAPALYQLIGDAQIVDMLATGKVSQEVISMVTLLVPQAGQMMSDGMTAVQAQQVLGSLPPEVAGLMREQLLSPEALTLALLSAHMIIFWLSQDSNVTPPVCLTAFTAAAIAGTRPMATGLQAWKLAKGIYILPLLFAYTPLLNGFTPESLATFLFAVPGLYAFAAAMQGHMEHPLNWLERVLAALAALALLWPTSLLINGTGTLLVVVVFIVARWRRVRGHRVVSEHGGLAQVR